MSVTIVYSQLEALCHAVQRRPPSRVEVDRQRVLLLSEIGKLAKEIEQNRETIAQLRRRNREHIKAEKELVRVLQLERRERALEHRQLANQVEHLQANCYREQERVASLTTENERWRLQAHPPRREASDGLRPSRSAGRATRPLGLRSRSDSNASFSSIRPKPYLLSEIEETCSDTSSSILADVPRHRIHLSQLDLERSIERQSHLDLDEYFWNRCPHKCACGMMCHEMEAEEYEAAAAAEKEAAAMMRVGPMDRRLCRIPSTEFNELFTSPTEQRPSLSRSHSVQRTSSVRRRQSLVRLVQEVVDMQNSCQTALDEVNEQIRKNRSRMRDARREVVKLQAIVTDTESRLEIAQQQAMLHTDTAQMTMDMARMEEYRCLFSLCMAARDKQHDGQ
ncbi:hypothetical protein SYNPS1DRAFT_26780 [Syncephalis pseudoplumigaleata]|uniref:Uncharacterized protein n=1 Tax=Syncephalis pseudoplumigaleata TaxID=1712513 RepID=A0A4P9Z4Q7_9FUNG|nr:hypothetical protein SYNPS1DRAFT_26780 [Syncephalis pseudoplumigaleata]|eukprot:RKP27574.1 hypothetical protein SYNPS1DRAFT_26780 [Syncephalis pseudoplumigaleata]